MRSPDRVAHARVLPPVAWSADREPHRPRAGGSTSSSANTVSRSCCGPCFGRLSPSKLATPCEPIAAAIRTDAELLHNEPFAGLTPQKSPNWPQRPECEWQGSEHKQEPDARSPTVRGAVDRASACDGGAPAFASAWMGLKIQRPQSPGYERSRRDSCLHRSVRIRRSARFGIALIFWLYSSAADCRRARRVSPVVE